MDLGKYGVFLERTCFECHQVLFSFYYLVFVRFLPLLLFLLLRSAFRLSLTKCFILQFLSIINPSIIYFKNLFIVSFLNYSDWEILGFSLTFIALFHSSKYLVKLFSERFG